jgi:hypothetical protein
MWRNKPPQRAFQRLSARPAGGLCSPTDRREGAFTVCYAMVSLYPMIFYAAVNKIIIKCRKVFKNILWEIIMNFIKYFFGNSKTFYIK